METITCNKKQLEVREIEQIGGMLNSTTDYTDTLYRGRDGRYYLEEETSTPLPLNASYTMPRDGEWVRLMEQRKTSTREIPEREAMLWFVTMFLNDNRLRKRFVDLIERLAD
jgi:hypothetical protein